MPSFSLAATWSPSARPEPVTEVLLGLAQLLGASGPLPLQVGLGEELVGVEVRLELAGYPRDAVARLGRQVAQSGGQLLELWRLPKTERDAQRARLLAGRVQAFTDAAQAARAVSSHLASLASRPAPRPAPRAAPVLVPPPPPAIPPLAAPSTPATATRRARRFDTRLEVAFHTELEFVLEHATNISNGGMFVRTALRPPVDGVVELEVRLPSGEVLHGHGVVRHHLEEPAPGGVGLEFLHDDAAFAAALDGYLASLAGDGA